jgi:competence protein ComEC
MKLTLLKFAKLSELLAQELDNFFLWIPVLIAFGVVIFFAFPIDPNPYICLAAFGITSVISLLVRKSPLWHFLSIVLLIFLTGFTTAAIRSELVKAPVLERQIDRAWIMGNVTEINNTEGGLKIILEELYISGYSDKLPHKIRLTIKRTIEKIEIGDRIGLFASLMPPPPPSLPKGFDYQQYAYFKQIGAIGYAISKVRILEKAAHLSGLQQYFSLLRQKVEARVFASMPASEAAIAVGILVGDSSAINAEEYEAIRKSGLAHIIAISGMHIVVVVGLIFITVRFLLSRLSYLPLRLDIKKVAAVIAIIGSLFYLLIAGSPLSAQRAFIMSTIVLAAIILDRKANPMRSVAIAATIILILTPEAILSASMQMSFAASIALVASFNLSSIFFKIKNRKGIITKTASYFATVTISTLVAGIATSPFIIYHFNQFSTYSVLSNLIAIPLADFIIMPAGIIAMLLMPLSLEDFALYPMQWGITAMLQVAQTVAALPNASFYVPSISDTGLVFITLGGLIICLFITQLKFLGLIPICIGLLGILDYAKPDIIISNNGKLFAVRDDIGILAFSSKVSSRFQRMVWQQSTGENFILSIKDAYLSDCSSSYCQLTRNGNTAVIVADPNEPGARCSDVEVFINLVDNSFICERAKNNVNLNMLRQRGTHLVYLNNDKVAIQTVSEFRERRIWNSKNYDRF